MVTMGDHNYFYINHSYTMSKNEVWKRNFLVLYGLKISGSFSKFKKKTSS